MTALRCVLEADSRWTADGWRVRLDLRVAGLPLLVRQLRCLRAAGIDHVRLVGAGWHGVDVPQVAGLHVERGPDRLGDLEQAGARCLVLAADTALDVRLVRQFVSHASGHPGPVVAVDRFEHHPPVGSKSPYAVGIPEPADLRVAEDTGPSWPIGLSVSGAPDERTTRLSVGRYTWYRVGDRSDARAATWALLLATMKRDDGLYSRLNRRISLRLSRILVGTPLTPNVATLLNALFSVLAALLMARGTWGFTVSGSLLLWCTCIFDGVDGEIARARFETSLLGEHLDVAEGAVFYVALVAGLGAAVNVMHPRWYLPLLARAGVASVAVWSATTFAVSWHAVRHRAKSDELYRVKMLEDSAGPVRALLRSCSFAFKRAAAGWHLALFALAGGLPYLFVPVIAGALLSAPIGLYVAFLILRESRTNARDPQKA